MTVSEDGATADQSASNRTITLGAILSYVFGGAALFFGLFYALSAPLSAVLFAIAGGVTFPPSRRALRARTGVGLGRWVVVVVFLVCWLMAAAILP